MDLACCELSIHFVTQGRFALAGKCRIIGEFGSIPNAVYMPRGFLEKSVPVFTFSHTCLCCPSGTSFLRRLLEDGTSLCTASCHSQLHRLQLLQLSQTADLHLHKRPAISLLHLAKHAWQLTLLLVFITIPL